MKLSIQPKSAIENNLYNQWCESGNCSWVSYIRSLDSSIIKVRYNCYLSPMVTEIWFENDAAKTWFLLRWS